MNRKMDVKVSVIIPVYNAEKYLRQCLDSVVNQSLRDIEIICVDDGSTDGSREILKRYAEKDKRLTVLINKENLHAGLSRNAGLERACGEYILFLDADDWLIENSLEEVYLKTASLKVDISRCRALEYDNSNGATLKSEFSYLKNVPGFVFNRVIHYGICPHILTKVNVAPWGGLYRREFLVENGLKFDDLLCCNDRPFYCKTILAAKRVVFLKSELVCYRINNSASLVGNRAKNFSCHFDSYNIISSATAELPVRLRKIYLTSELFDIAHWLEKSLETEWADEAKRKTEQFLSQMDVSPWGGKISSERWYKRIENRKKRYEESLRDEQN